MPTHSRFRASSAHWFMKLTIDGNSPLVAPHESLEGLLGQTTASAVAAAVLQMVISRHGHVSGVAGEQHDPAMLIICGIEPDFVGSPHGIAGMGE